MEGGGFVEFGFVTRNEMWFMRRPISDSQLIRLWEPTAGQWSVHTFVLYPQCIIENCYLWALWPDLVIYWTLGNFLKPLATTNLFKSLTFLGYYCKGVKIYHFFTEIILGNFYRHLAIFSGHTVCEMSGWWLVSFTFLCWPIIIQGPIP